MKKEMLMEIAKGMTLGAVVLFALIGSAAIYASGIDSKLPEEYTQYCEEAGRIYNICPELLEAIIEAESGGDPDAVGQAGEIGLMQIYPMYHMNRMEDIGVRYLFDPRSNIFVGADYLAELFEEHKDTGTVLMVYNGVQNAKERGKIGNYTEYAKSIMKQTISLERAREEEEEHGRN